MKVNIRQRLYRTTGLHDLGDGIFDLFLYFYFYTLGYSIFQIVLYMLVFYLAQSLITPLTARLISRRGPWLAMAIGVISHIIFILAIVNLGHWPWIFFGLAAYHGFSENIYWIGRHCQSAWVSQLGQAGQQVAKIEIYRTLASFIGPLIGGLVASLIDYRLTLLLALTCLGLSLKPLWEYRLAKPPGPVKPHSFWLTLKRYYPTWITYGVKCLTFVPVFQLWSLYLALVVFTDNTYGWLGATMAFASLGGSLVAWWTGRLADRQRYRLPLVLTTIGQGCLAIWRFFITSSGLAIAHNLIYEQTYRLADITLDKQSFDQANSDRQTSLVYYLAWRELVSLVIRALYLLCVVIGFWLAVEGEVGPQDLKPAYLAIGALIPFLLFFKYQPKNRP